MIDKIIFIFLIIFLNIYILKNIKKIKFFNLNLDYPDFNRKIHKNPIPLAGGPILIFNICIFFIFFRTEFSNLNLLIFSSLVFILGYIDDRINLSYISKFFFLILIFSFIYIIEKKVHVIDLYIENLNYTYDIEKYSYIFTIFCLLLLSNALNMYDGINSQCITFTIITFIYLLLLKFNFFIFFLIMVFFFLNILNFKNKIFLGDSGTYLSAILLAYFIIIYYNLGLIKNIETIFVILMIPGLDMLRLFFVRIINKKNPFKPDKKHFHHIIMDKFSYMFAILILSILHFINVSMLLIGINEFLIILIYLFTYILLLNVNFKKSS